MGDCKYCGHKAGWFRSSHKECDAAHRRGRQQMVAMVAESASQPDFNESALLDSLSQIAVDSFVDQDDLRAVIAEGWREAVREGLADGVLTQGEEARLREFREQFAIDTDNRAAGEAAQEIEQAARARLMTHARLAAISTDTADGYVGTLRTALEGSGLSQADRRTLLAQGWEAAVETSLEDGVLSLDEEHALNRYLDDFELEQADVNANGAYRSMIQSIVIREAAEGLIPNRLSDVGHLPFNLMKSEQLVWVINGVDYYEVKTRRERRGSSHGLSIRVAKGLYYRPSTFRSRSVEWDETVFQDTGMLGVTSKHIYFHGPKKRFRIRYDRIVSFDPYSDGIGVMRDAQTAKPQTFITGDGWFIYNLVTNLAQHW